MRTLLLVFGPGDGDTITAPDYPLTYQVPKLKRMSATVRPENYGPCEIGPLEVVTYTVRYPVKTDSGDIFIATPEGYTDRQINGHILQVYTNAAKAKRTFEEKDDDD